MDCVKENVGTSNLRNTLNADNGNGINLNTECDSKYTDAAAAGHRTIEVLRSPVNTESFSSSWATIRELHDTAKKQTEMATCDHDGRNSDVSSANDVSNNPNIQSSKTNNVGNTYDTTSRSIKNQNKPTKNAHDNDEPIHTNINFKETVFSSASKNVNSDMIVNTNTTNINTISKPRSNIKVSSTNVNIKPNDTNSASKRTANGNLPPPISLPELTLNLDESFISPVAHSSIAFPVRLPFWSSDKTQFSTKFEVAVAGDLHHNPSEAKLTPTIRKISCRGVENAHTAHIKGSSTGEEVEQEQEQEEQQLQQQQQQRWINNEKKETKNDASNSTNSLSTPKRPIRLSSNRRQPRNGAYSVASQYQTIRQQHAHTHDNVTDTGKACSKATDADPHSCDSTNGSSNNNDININNINIINHTNVNITPKQERHDNVEYQPQQRTDGSVGSLSSRRLKSFVARREANMVARAVEVTSASTSQLPLATNLPVDQQECVPDLTARFFYRRTEDEFTQTPPRQQQQQQQHRPKVHRRINTSGNTGRTAASSPPTHSRTSATTDMSGNQSFPRTKSEQVPVLGTKESVSTNTNTTSSVASNATASECERDPELQIARRLREVQANNNSSSSGNGNGGGKRTSVLTFYDIMGVEPTSAHEEVKLRFHQLCRQVHPDRNAHVSAKDDFQALIHIHNILKTPSSRKAYNCTIGLRPNGQPFIRRDNKK